MLSMNIAGSITLPKFPSDSMNVRIVTIFFTLFMDRIKYSLTYSRVMKLNHMD